MDYAALRTEITTDPQHMGFASLVTAGNDSGIASALNLATGPGAGTLTAPSMLRDDFSLAILPLTLVLAGKDAATQAKWDRILAFVRSSNAVSVTSPTVQQLFGLAQQDGLMTQQQAAAIGQRACSRAETLFGAGVVVGQADVSFALRSAK